MKRLFYEKMTCVKFIQYWPGEEENIEERTGKPNINSHKTVFILRLYLSTLEELYIKI